MSLAHDLMQRHQAAKRQDETADVNAAGATVPEQVPGHDTRTGTALRSLDKPLDTARALVDVNQAPPHALRALQPITRKRAKRIVAHRPFKQVKQLKRVLPKGVYRSIKDQLTV